MNSEYFHTRLISLLLLASMLIGIGCSEDFVDNPKANQPPETNIAIFSSNQLSPTISKQTINWWGDDPDGIVIGFVYSFAEDAPDIQEWDEDAPSPDWVFTSETQETFTLTLGGTDTVYTLKVKAIDDDGAADPTAAVQSFPIINTVPMIEFPVGTDVPETTFTVANFTWNGTDLDGDDTIARYQFVLDDTSDADRWNDIPPDQSGMTLTAEDGLTEGEHVLFMRAVDIAGAVSAVIRMPRSEDAVWFVKEPRSNFLIVDDYNINDNTGTFYNTSLRAIVGSVDVWDIKTNDQALDPPSSEAFARTLLLFDRVFWYSDTEPNLEKAQVAIPLYLDAGKNIIMTTSFQEFTSNQGDPLDFSPVDSLGTKINRITRNQLVQPTDRYSSLGFTDLRVNTAIIPNIFPLVPKISSEVMFRLPENSNLWEGMPAVGVIDGTRSFVFFGLPLASINGNDNIDELISKILNEIF